MSEIVELHGQFYILASSSLADVASSVLKHGDTFAVFDRHGDIRPLGFETQGLFHEGTRFISRLKLQIGGKSPLLLSSNVREDNDLLATDLTNPDLTGTDGAFLPSGIIHIVRTIFLWDGCCFERIEISNFSLSRIASTLSLSYQADFADLFEVRGITRPGRGETLPPETSPNAVILAYRGLDGVVRRTELRFGQNAAAISAEQVRFDFELEPQETRTFDLRIACHVGEQEPPAEPFDVVFERVRQCCADYRGIAPILDSSNAQFNDWVRQSHADLHMLLTRMEPGLYPFAGIPWFSCPFGRDGIFTALETLWVNPEIARGVLRYLADTQASEKIDAQDAEPGKILHERRKGEMAALGEIPFGCYYGTIDATPLFIVLAGRYYERTSDLEFLKSLWPNIERALLWIDRHGDSDGDGFVEYCRHDERGLRNQGWKDSEDSIFHSDGTLASAPIALCEVQGYVFEAKMVAARIAMELGHTEIAARLDEEAARLQKAFHQAFWCEDLGFYALALDGEKRPCRVRSSNAGHCLFSGIATAEHAQRISAALLGDDFFSGWGIRTIPTDARRYNPMSYHNGSIWPHDNAVIAYGLTRYGHTQAALRVLSALFDASLFMDLNRLPELYCGFARRPGEGPTLYPVACNPQAWASASVFFLIQACLGLRIDGKLGCVYLERPALPESVPSIDIRGLKLPAGSVDLHLQRHAGGVAVNVSKRSGIANVVVAY